MKFRHAAVSGCIFLALAIPAACQLFGERGGKPARARAIGIVRTAAAEVRQEMAQDPAVHVPDTAAALRAAQAHLSEHKVVTAGSSATGFTLVARFDQNWYDASQQYRVRLCVEYGATPDPAEPVHMIDATCPPDPTFQSGLDEFVKLAS
ncbi:hypothetical protein [Amycolatopsis sp. lyj-23]|uniref:hypothetical protein n=1 Tax=Amycolatopsis sp. lyj-23 TaxID=2789283 RepID=UPI00397DC929